MKSQFQIPLTLLFVLLFCSAVGQKGYKPGYYLNSSGQTVNGYVKNVDWKNSPNSIDFRATEEGETKTISLYQMQGFGINGQVEYVKKTFELDITSDNLNNLDFSKEPEFKTTTALLEVVVTGPAKLYFYEKEGIRKYFYALDSDKVEALVYVRYLKDKKVASNERYKQQLATAFNGCGSLSNADFERLNYKQKPLRNLFENFNSCVDPNYSVVRNEKTKTLLNLNLYGGLNASSVEVTNAVNARLGGDFGSQTNFRFGAELELILPFNNNTFAIYMGFAKNSNFNSTIVQELSSTNTPEQEVELTYTTVNLPLGMRYFIPLNTDTKISLELGYHIDFISDLKLDRSVTANDFSSQNGSYGYFSLGAGAQYKQFFGRANIDIGKDPFNAASFEYQSDVSSFNLIFGYQIPLMND